MSDAKLEYVSFKTWIPILSIIAGICLLPLFLIAFLQSFSSDLFIYIFTAHIAILLIAVCASLLFFIRLSIDCRWHSFFCIAILLLFVSLIIISSATPIISRDALIHHLVVPKWWIEAGKIIPIQWHEWSYYPMLLNMGYSALLLFDLEQLCPFYHFSYLILLCGVVSTFCYYKSKESEIAVLSFILTLALPICIRLALSPLVDLGLALYVCIAICFLIYWTEIKQEFYYIFAAGLALGLAMSIKYNGILAAGLILLLLIILAKRAGLSYGLIFKAFLLCSFVTLAIAMTWFLKNLYWTGNPVYPLFKSLMGPELPALGIQSLRPIEKLRILYGESWLDILLMPLKMILVGQDNDPRFYDGRLSPILFISLFPLLKIRKNPWLIFFYLFLLFYFYLAISFSSARVRYMAPLFGPVLILTAMGIQQAGTFFESRHRPHIYSILGFTYLIFSIHYAYFLVRDLGLRSFYLNKETKQIYLEKHISEYEMIAYINQHLSGTDRVYLLFTGNRFYYYEKQVLSGGYFSGNMIMRLLKQSPNIKLFIQQLKNLGLSYFLVHTERTRDTFESLLKGKDRQLWNEFHKNHLEFVHQVKGLSLWKVKFDSLKTDDLETDSTSALTIEG